MNKKVMAAIYGCVVLWIVAFVQIGISAWGLTDATIVQAFARNQMVIQESSIELKAYLGKVKLDEKALKKQYGDDISIRQTVAGKLSYVHIRLDHRSDILTHENELRQIMDDAKVKDYQLSAWVQGSCQKELDEQERQRMVDSIFRNMSAVNVKKASLGGCDTYYGYAAGLTDQIVVDGRRTNVNIAFTYNEKKKCTEITLGVPSIDRDF